MLMVLSILNVAAELFLAALLLVFCFRSRSKGLILLTAVILISRRFGSTFNHFFDNYIMGQIPAQEVGHLIINVGMIKNLLYISLLALSIFWIYKDLGVAKKK